MEVQLLNSLIPIAEKENKQKQIKGQLQPLWNNVPDPFNHCQISNLFTFQTFSKCITSLVQGNLSQQNLNNLLIY